MIGNGLSTRLFAQVEGIIRYNIGRLVDIRLAPYADDAKKATDLVISIDSGTVALRVRDAGCPFRDFTIRSSVPSGKQTELHKLREGYGRWYLYCWRTRSGVIRDWILVDMDKMRASGLLYRERQDIKNPDGTCFRVFTIDELRKNDCIVAASLGKAKERESVRNTA